MASPIPETRCQAGDVAVTLGPNGYVLGHAYQAPGLGLGWEAMFTFSTLDEACRIAIQLATKSAVAAWLRLGARYIPLDTRTPVRDPEPSAAWPPGVPETVRA